MMKILKYGLLGMFLILGSQSVLAQDRFDHYEGEPARSLEQALKNFAEYNAKLESVLQRELTPEDMAEIHQLTYTLENALERISIELEQLAETLEEVHLGSERLEYDGVREAARLYLETARKIEK